MIEILRTGKFCEMTYDTEIDKYVIKTPDGDYSFGIKKRMLAFFNDMENKYRIINK